MLPVAKERSKQLPEPAKAPEPAVPDPKKVQTKKTSRPNSAGSQGNRNNQKHVADPTAAKKGEGKPAQPAKGSTPLLPTHVRIGEEDKKALEASGRALYIGLPKASRGTGPVNAAEKHAITWTSSKGLERVVRSGTGYLVALYTSSANRDSARKTLTVEDAPFRVDAQLIQLTVENFGTPKSKGPAIWYLNLGVFDSPRDFWRDIEGKTQN